MNEADRSVEGWIEAKKAERCQFTDERLILFTVAVSLLIECPALEAYRICREIEKSIVARPTDNILDWLYVGYSMEKSQQLNRKGYKLVADSLERRDRWCDWVSVATMYE